MNIKIETPVYMHEYDNITNKGVYFTIKNMNQTIKRFLEKKHKLIYDFEFYPQDYYLKQKNMYVNIYEKAKHCITIRVENGYGILLKFRNAEDVNKNNVASFILTFSRIFPKKKAEFLNYISIVNNSYVLRN